MITYRLRQRPKKCFNPCFHGSRSSARSPRVSRPRDSVVSILVFMDLGHRLRQACEARRLSSVFQSLFSWISVIGTSATFSMLRHHRSFNPCFHGSRSSATRKIGECRRGGVSILVFMDLGHRLLNRVRSSPALASMFQSLFSWISVIGTAIRHRDMRYSRVFQSLFSWISVIGRARGVGRLEPKRVSILVFMDLGHRHDFATPWRLDRGFQSLFSWISVIGHG